jgi:hypothetical protein
MARPKTKTARVITMLEQGKSTKEIVRVAKVSPQLVYAVRAKMRSDAPKIGISAVPVAKLVPTLSGIAGLKAADSIRAHDKPYQAPKQTWWCKIVGWFRGRL